MFAFSAPLAAETVRLTLLGMDDICKLWGGPRAWRLCPTERGGQGGAGGQPGHAVFVEWRHVVAVASIGIHQGVNTIAFNSLLQFDLAVPGNHEFDSGPEVFKQRMEDVKYPWVAINITNADCSPVEKLGGVLIRKLGDVGAPDLIGPINAQPAQQIGVGVPSLTIT